jgi:hypothetical protein
MTYRKESVRGLLAIGGAALLLGWASGHPAAAQGVNSMPDGPVACQDAMRTPPGAWHIMRPMTITPNGVPMTLQAGQTWTPGETLPGDIEPTAVLDRNCGNP